MFKILVGFLNQKISFDTSFQNFSGLLRELLKEGYAVTCVDNLIFGGESLLDIWHKLLLETWHTETESIVHIIQNIAHVSSTPIIKKAMHTSYPLLESYETGVRQFISQCGHTLWSINTMEAVVLIEDLTNSKNPIIQDEMQYRLNRIQGKNDYKRNYNLDA